jgi:uncharacterized membrane protein
MQTIEKSVEVDVPVTQVYNQWTQFEEFPKFMEGVEQVQQLDDKRLHWVAEIAGRRKEWDAEIFEQVRDQKIAWRSTSGAQNAGIVTFRPLDSDRTQITVRMEYEPDGAIEAVGSALGAVSGRIEGDLERFKKFIQSRGQETGAWRGEIHGGKVETGGSGDTHSSGPSSPSYGTMGRSGLS